MELEHRAALDAIFSQWSMFKPTLNAILDGETSTEAIENVTIASADLDTELVGAGEYFSTMTFTTTKIPINIMLPLPITGSWNPGRTMQIAAMIAEDIINVQQVMLPGYRIIADFFDDQCDPDQANRAMLEKFASSNQWIGVGGMGCESVCKSLSVIAASLFIPIVSFECSAGEDLSDATLFPDFARLGTKRSSLPNILMEMKNQLGWETLSIISSENTEEKQRAEHLKDELPDFPSSLSSVEGDDWDAIQTMMRDLKTDKKRIIFFVGGESLYRKVICASGMVDTLPGLTWISEGIKSRAWWTEDDPDVMAIDPGCTGSLISELYQGGVTITGLGAPPEEDRNLPLDCFQGYTANSLNEYVRQRLEVGYPPEDPNATGVDAPYVELINLAVDGICVFAKTVERMLKNGVPIEDLRTPQQDTYRSVVRTIKRNVKFNGASGYVDFQGGNDVKNLVVAWQARGNQSIMVGRADLEGMVNISWAHSFDNSSYAPAPEDAAAGAEEGFPILAVVIPTLVVFFCAIICYAAYTGRSASTARSGSFSNQA